MNYNKDQAKRDAIIFGVKASKLQYMGGICSFSGLSHDKLKQLITEGFADPEDCQNCSPSIGEILGFLERNPKFKAHGYTVEVSRNDYRVSIEGVECTEGMHNDELDEFITMFRDADDFTIQPNAYAWYD